VRWLTVCVLVACSARPQLIPPTQPPVPIDAAIDAAIDAPPDAPAIPQGDVANARRLYDEKACSSCHTITGVPRVGPSWLGLWDTDEKLEDGRVVHVDAAYIRTSITDPLADVVAGYPHAMPSYAESLTAAEIDDFVAFIYSLRSLRAQP
jgi:cytochrome c oxidase subunit 2